MLSPAAGAREVPDDLSTLLGGDDQDDVADRSRGLTTETDPVVVVDVPGLVAEHLAGRRR